ncbi:MAG TPA: hypothetical protein VII37_02295 [Candidatus Acidoferrum sp.]
MGQDNKCCGSDHRFNSGMQDCGGSRQELMVNGAKIRIESRKEIV